MLAKTGKAFDDENYFFEPKWDGLRALLFLRQRKLELQNRNLRDATGSYPELQRLEGNIRAKTAIIDGEVVVLGENGTPNFGHLQARFGVDDPKRVSMLAKTTPVTYVAFDLLHIDGQDVISWPLVERKRWLKSIVKDSPYLLYGEHVEAEGTRFFKEATDRGFEGVIAKESQSQYVPGLRTDYWIKIKQVNTTECVVVGFSAGEGARARTFGSLILAAYDDEGRMQHVVNVGGGFCNDNLGQVKRKLDNLRTTGPTIQGPLGSPTHVSWVKPR